MNDVLSAAILLTFVVLLTLGAASTLLRVYRYRRMKLPRPVLLGRDRDLLIGLAIPFLAIALVRAFSLQWLINDNQDQPHIWWLLITGIPPIYALARYDFYELFVIERQPLPEDAANRLIEVAEEAAEKVRIAALDAKALLDDDSRSAAATERVADATERVADVAEGRGEGSEKPA